MEVYGAETRDAAFSFLYWSCVHDRSRAPLPSYRSYRSKFGNNIFPIQIDPTILLTIHKYIKTYHPRNGSFATHARRALKSGKYVRKYVYRNLRGFKRCRMRNYLRYLIFNDAYCYTHIKNMTAERVWFFFIFIKSYFVETGYIYMFFF